MQVAVYNNYVVDPCRVPLAMFQCENYLPSILNPPPPPPPPHAPLPPRRHDRGPPLSDRLGPPPEKRRRREPAGERGPPAPPPKGASLDPRAQRGATAYADLVRSLVLIKAVKRIAVGC